MFPRQSIAITAGDPCGIGPEVILKALASVAAPARMTRVVIGDYAIFERTAQTLRLRLPAWHVVHPDQSWPLSDRALIFLDRGSSSAARAGRPSRESGKASLAYLEMALALWKAKRISALVTGPVTKWAINLSHPGFAGQTEYLAHALHVRDVVMMFVSDSLKIALLTRHLPLRDVASTVDRALMRTTLRLTHRALTEYFKVSRPRLAVCGLNPHAGEAGLYGREEQTVLLPVMRHVRQQGVRCEGPFAADGLFAEPRASDYDAVICWYHDQGLIPFKMAARDRGCQLSVGLPLIRTSPDHGSAPDIAGRGLAHPGSMRYAIQLAATLARSGER